MTPSPIRFPLRESPGSFPRSLPIAPDTFRIPRTIRGRGVEGAQVHLSSFAIKGKMKPEGVGMFYPYKPSPIWFPLRESPGSFTTHRTDRQFSLPSRAVHKDRTQGGQQRQAPEAHARQDAHGEGAHQRHVAPGDLPVVCENMILAADVCEDYTVIPVFRDLPI